MIRRLGKPVALLLVAGSFVACAAPPPAAAFNPAKPICSLAGLVSTLAGKVCSAASHPGRVLKAGKKLLGGHVGGALESLSGSGTAVKALTAGAAVAAIVSWVSGGTKFALHETATVIASTTRPELESTWFSASYWRMAEISALLTLPLLFAAAIQALMRSDMAMLARSALAYLPLGMLAVSIAAPLTMLLLAGSDEMSAIVSSASGDASGSFLAHASVITTVVGGVSGSTFLTFVVGLLTVAATITLWVELLIRSAAVYVIVLMLPLFFAALVWPARRVWAVRAVEVLIALILSKFVIVAVLSLGAAALDHTLLPSVTETLEGTTLVVLAAFSPWALLRLLPLHELASGLDGLRARAQPLALAPDRGDDATERAEAFVRDLPTFLLQRASASSAEPEAAKAAVGGLAQDQDGLASPDADDGASNGAVVAADGSGGTPSATAVPGPASGSPAATAAGRTAEADAAPEPSAARKERHPGMEARWQVPDEDLPTGALGLGGLSPETWLEPESRLEETDATGEDHDPRPPAQESDGGPL